MTTVKNNTVFVYFCGTDEHSSKHLGLFMSEIDAAKHIYINGVGTAMMDYQKEKPESVTHVSGYTNLGRNSRRYWLEFGGKEIYAIEKEYSGGAGTGYVREDSTRVAKYAAGILEELFYADSLVGDQHKKINNLVFVGHSRGAAVGLPSFLHELVESQQAKPFIPEGIKVHVVFLDPVSGQSSNKYPGRLEHDNWHSIWLYNLMKALPLKWHITEIYANAAAFDTNIVTSGILKNFNPARRFLHDAYDWPDWPLRRFLLGFRHSALVNPHEQHNHRYADKSLIPYNLIVDYINKLVAGTPGNDRETEKLFEKSDQHLLKNLLASERENVNKQIKNRRDASFEDLNKKKVNLKSFVSRTRSLYNNSATGYMQSVGNHNGGGYFEIRADRLITGISIRSGGMLDAIEIQDNNGNTHKTGGGGGVASELKLPAGAYINKVVIGYKDHDFPKYLAVTYQGKTHAWGEKGADLKYAECSAPEGYCLAGFHGTSGAYIDSLGVIFDKIPA
jgi:hypothetical protein